MRVDFRQRVTIVILVIKFLSRRILGFVSEDISEWSDHIVDCGQVHNQVLPQTDDIEFTQKNRIHPFARLIAMCNAQGSDPIRGYTESDCRDLLAGTMIKMQTCLFRT
jgi:hypothetical protein